MLAFVILNYNTWEETLKCVGSIFETCKQEYKIYIVDNGSKNKSYQRLKEQYENNGKVKLIQSENYGYAIGNNIGIREAIRDGFDIVTIVNNDVIFLDDSINNMYSFLVNNPDAAVAAPYILSPNGEFQNVPTLKPMSKKNYFLYNTRIQLLTSKNSRLKFRRKLYLSGESIKEEPILIHKFSGCCFMAKSKMLEQVGLFDENTFLYYEEDILCFKMKSHGYKVYFLPNAKIVHYHGLTTGKVNLFVDTEMLKSEMYLLVKYYKMNIFGLFFIYFDRAITPLISKLKHKYDIPLSEYTRFLSETYEHFMKWYRTERKT